MKNEGTRSIVQQLVMTYYAVRDGINTTRLVTSTGKHNYRRRKTAFQLTVRYPGSVEITGR